MILRLLRTVARLSLTLFPCVCALAQQPQLTAQEALNQWRASKAATLRDDFGELARYRDANAALQPPAPGENRVIGTVDVESEQANAFSARDQQMLEQCAQAALPLWLLR